MEALILIVSAVVTILGIFLSKPERFKIALLTAVIIFSVAVWQAYEAYSKARLSQTLHFRAINQLSSQLHSFLGLLSESLVRGSDGGLPTTANEFFSPRTAEIICQQLNIDRSGPIDPPRPYDTWFAEASQRFRAALRQVLQESAQYLDADLVRAIAELENDWFLGVGQSRRQLRSFDLQLNVSRPPILCWGAGPLMGDFLDKLNRLYQQVNIAERTVNIERRREWLEYPPHYLARYLSVDRFSPADLEKWIADHPRNPGPGMYGKGDPRKTPQLDPRSPRP